ncbi:MAG: hypothetical protein ABL866_07460 [Devosia sp.]
MPLTADDLFILSLLSFAVWLPCALFAYRGARLPFYHPISFYLVYHFMGFVLRPLALGLVGHSGVWAIMGIWPTSEEVSYAIAISAIALVTIVLAPIVFVPGLYRDTQFSGFELKVGSKPGLAAGLAIVAILGVVGASSTATFSDFDVSTLTTEAVEGGGNALVGTSGYLTMLSDYLIVVVIFVIALSRHRLVVLSVVLAFIIFRLTQGSGRYTFISVAIAFATVELVRAGRRQPKLWHLLAAVSLILAFDVIGSDRLAFRSIVQGSTTIEETLQRYGETRAPELLSGDFGEIENLVATMRVVHTTGRYNWGSQYLRLIIWPIPRQIWPEKPVYTDLLGLARYSKVFNIITVTMVGDTYTNFGPLAVLLGFVLYGLGFSAAHKYAAQTTNPVWFLAFLLMTGFITLYYRDGVIGGIYRSLITLPAIFFLVWIGKVSLVRMVPVPRAGAAYAVPEDRVARLDHRQSQ